MRFIGGRAVFSFDTVYETSGILAPRCVKVTGDNKYHFVATQDDVILHSGGEPISVVDRRLRREIFNAIDTVNFNNSFCYIDAENNLAVFAFPEGGHTHPNRGLAFNYRTGILTELDGITYRNVADSRVESSGGETWGGPPADTWDGGVGIWNTQERRKLVFCGTDEVMFFQGNSGNFRNGATFASTLQRTSLAMIGKKRDGSGLLITKL